MTVKAAGPWCHCPPVPEGCRCTNMLTPRFLVLLGVPALLCLTACGEDPAPVPGAVDAGGQPLPEAAVGACTTGQTQSCGCATDAAVLAGTQSCYGGSWLLCNCNAPYDAG